MNKDRARIASHVTDRELERLMHSFLDRLNAALPMTDEQAVGELSKHEATLMFAESNPCWTREEL